MARRLALAWAAALVLAGCGQGEGIVRGGTILGETLTVYSLLPQPERGVARDVVDGQRLALQQAGGRAGAFKVNFASLDSTDGGETGAELPGAVAGATRRAIADAQVVAVIGDLEPRTAEITVPLLNAAGILHVSPCVRDGRFAAPRFYPAGERTFFTVPPAAAAGPLPGFEQAFGRPPTRAAARGHAAMRSVLAAIARAGPRASNRQAVIEAYRAAAPS